LLTAAVLLYLGIWVFFIALPTDSSALPMKHRVAVITIIVLGSMALAIVPKLFWGFANAGLHGRTPPGFLVGAGAAAVLFAVVVNLIAGTLIYGEWSGALQRLEEGLPYLPSAFMTAAAMGWLVQDHRWLSIKSIRLKRTFDGLSLGAVWVVATIIANLIKLAMHIDVPSGRIAGEVIGALAFGVIIGYLIPALARMRVDRPPAVRFQNMALSLAPAATRTPAHASAAIST
jgi:hypothetical protein